MPEELSPTKAENPAGLHQRYKVERTDGTPIDPNAVFFVLRLDNGGKSSLHASAGRAAAKEWARVVIEDDINGDLLKVAMDLFDLIERLEASGS